MTLTGTRNSKKNGVGKTQVRLMHSTAVTTDKLGLSRSATMPTKGRSSHVLHPSTHYQ